MAPNVVKRLPHQCSRCPVVLAPAKPPVSDRASRPGRLGSTGGPSGATAAAAEHAESSGEMGLMATALEGLARAALTTHEPARAAELLARAAAVRGTFDRPATPTEAAVAAATAAAANRALAETADPPDETGRTVNR